MNKVDVDLYMLRATMMNRIGSHIDCTNIVAIDNARRTDQDMKLLKQLAQPAALSNCFSNSSVMYLPIGPRYCGLPF
jgi:hypothetical protein